MKALSVREPYATYIADGVKIIENRSWKPSERFMNVPIALHRCACEEPAIIAVFKIKEVLRPRQALKKYPYQKEHINIDIPDIYSWVVEVIKKVEPIPIKGSLSFWDVPPRIVKRIGV